MQQLFKGKKYASYYQFYLEDKASTQSAEEICIDANFEKLLGVGNQMLVINTNRYDYVKVSLTLFDQAPKVNLAASERINECSLLITSTLKLGSEISSDWTECEIEPNVYRVRILYKNLGTAKEQFRIQLWKETEMRETLYLK